MKTRVPAGSLAIFCATHPLEIGQYPFDASVLPFPFPSRNINNMTYMWM